MNNLELKYEKVHQKLLQSKQKCKNTSKPGIPEDCKAVIMNICANNGVHLAPQDIERAHRIGPKGKEDRPIIVKFTHFKRQSENFEGQNKVLR